MSQVLIRDLSPETVHLLKERAKRNRRSLQAEVREILEAAAGESEREATRKRRLEEILQFAAEMRERSGPQSTDSVELIRRQRDA